MGKRIRLLYNVTSGRKECSERYTNNSTVSEDDRYEMDNGILADVQGEIADEPRQL